MQPDARLNLYIWTAVYTFSPRENVSFVFAQLFSLRTGYEEMPPTIGAANKQYTETPATDHAGDTLLGSTERNRTPSLGRRRNEFCLAQHTNTPRSGRKFYLNDYIGNFFFLVWKWQLLYYNYMTTIILELLHYSYSVSVFYTVPLRDKEWNILTLTFRSSIETNIQYIYMCRWARIDFLTHVWDE